MCKESLVKAGFIKIIEGYYVLSEQQCVEPKRGNLTKKVEEDIRRLEAESVALRERARQLREGARQIR